MALGSTAHLHQSASSSDVLKVDVAALPDVTGPSTGTSNTADPSPATVESCSTPADALAAGGQPCVLILPL